MSIQEQIQKKEEQERKRSELLEEYTKRIVHHGLWQSTVEVDNMVESYKTTAKKIEAQKGQLNFRKQVLHQKS